LIALGGTLVFRFEDTESVTIISGNYIINMPFQFAPGSSNPLGALQYLYILTN